MTEEGDARFEQMGLGLQQREVVTLTRWRRIARRVMPSLRYLSNTEVHVYASSIAANTLLSFFPFTLLLLTVCRWLRWGGAYSVILELVKANLPSGADFVTRSLTALVGGKHRLQVISVLMLLFTSSGVFLPLETALNKIWRIPRNRSYVRNQALAFTITLAFGILALLSILLTTVTERAVVFSLSWLPWEIVTRVASRTVLEVFSLPALVVIYFVIFYFLPNGRVPARRVLPAAVVVALATEVGKFVYLVSLPLFRFREVYGPFTLPVTLLFWAFMGALILLSGAHLSAQGFWEQGASPAVRSALQALSHETNLSDGRNIDESPAGAARDPQSARGNPDQGTA